MAAQLGPVGGNHVGSLKWLLQQMRWGFASHAKTMISSKCYVIQIAVMLKPMKLE